MATEALTLPEPVLEILKNVKDFVGPLIPAEPSTFLIGTAVVVGVAGVALLAYKFPDQRKRLIDAIKSAVSLHDGWVALTAKAWGSASWKLAVAALTALGVMFGPAAAHSAPPRPESGPTINVGDNTGDVKIFTVHIHVTVNVNPPSKSEDETGNA